MPPSVTAANLPFTLQRRVMRLGLLGVAVAFHLVAFQLLSIQTRMVRIGASPFEPMTMVTLRPSISEA